MKKYLRSYSVVLPIAELLLAAGLILVPALVFFFRLKHAAHGSGHVLIHTGQFQTRVPSEGFFSFAFFRATAAAAKSIHSGTTLGKGLINHSANSQNCQTSRRCDLECIVSVELDLDIA
jgi:hypothetical protein